MSKLKNNKGFAGDSKGFTLVEIVIVLAIAALVLAGILLAVQGAQQSRRDSARRDAAGTIGSLLEESAGNHNGSYPSQGGTTVGQFNTVVTTRTQNPDGGEYIMPATFGTAADGCPTTIAGANTVQIDVTTNRRWEVCMGLESGDWFRANN